MEWMLTDAEHKLLEQVLSQVTIAAGAPDAIAVCELIASIKKKMGGMTAIAAPIPEAVGASHVHEAAHTGDM